MLFGKETLKMAFTSYGKARSRFLDIFIQTSIIGQSFNLSVRTVMETVKASRLSVWVQQAGFIALTKLTCLMLPHEHCSLLHSKSIWSEHTLETCSLVERILHLEPIEVDVYKGITPPDAPRYQKVFGGQIIGQARVNALAAASKTVDSLRIAHSLHAYFILAAYWVNPNLQENKS
ncbi:acyl-CoA thioesterase 2 [Tanacetum coccineum]|uniref:Acyl-CoA thioesterase 2 n=1 Tax=Tanacetum coccineum TaxID=301880 RepID=A0ABQ4XKX5_9ASTR